VKKLRISAAAERDLDAIRYYIATRSGHPDTASRFVESLVTRLSVLAPSPKAGKARARIEGDLRALPLGRYIAYYHERARIVVVSRIIHGSREQASAFSKNPEANRPTLTGNLELPS
jgi:plasmid stabilization system protein ParE